MIQAGADLNKPGKYRYTPSHSAAYYGHVDCLRLLIKAGADMSITTIIKKKAKTPLQVAENSKNYDCVKLLSYTSGYI